MTLFPFQIMLLTEATLKNIGISLTRIDYLKLLEAGWRILYIHLWTGLALVQLMACFLVGTNADLSPNEPSGTNFGEILIKITQTSVRFYQTIKQISIKMHVKMVSAIGRPQWFRNDYFNINKSKHNNTVFVFLNCMWFSTLIRFCCICFASF